MSLRRVVVELLLLTLTLWLQSAGVAGLIAWVRRALEGVCAKQAPSALLQRSGLSQSKHY
jgi:hypothetical protein